jgi:hypothetical protein
MIKHGLLMQCFPYFADISSIVRCEFIFNKTKYPCFCVTIVNVTFIYKVIVWVVDSFLKTRRK